MKCMFVRDPFAKLIVYGVKSIEYRTRPTNIRGRIGIIESGTGTIIGDAVVWNCKKLEGFQLYEWCLCCQRRYRNPHHFQQKRGAVVWINVDYDPERKEFMPDLSKSEWLDMEYFYRKELDKFFEKHIQKITSLH